MTIQPGTRLGPHGIEAAIGAGGMGEVYRARDTRLDRTVAIKVLSPALASDPQFRERFEREAKVISSLEHPHICALYDVGRDQGVLMMAVEVRAAERMLEAGMPRALFKTGFREIGAEIYAAARDGQRFLLSLPLDEAAAGAEPLTVMLNWTAGLKR